MDSSKSISGRKRGNAPYKGIRVRKWGRWVAEIREPSKQTRLWLGSYSSPIAAARAYDTAVFYLRGSNAKLNFPDEAPLAVDFDLTPEDIRKIALQVGARVDALQKPPRARPLARNRIDLNRNPPDQEENPSNGE